MARAYHLARGESERWIVIARWGSYHGNTLGALDLSGRRPLRRPYEAWLGRGDRRDGGDPSRGPAALLHGDRDPEAILEVIEAGVDMFDCVLPTRTARTRSATTCAAGSICGTRATRATPDRSTPTATARRARASAGVPSAPREPERAPRLRLLSLHNLRFLLELTRDARDAIAGGEFAQFKRRALERLAWEA